MVLLEKIFDIINRSGLDYCIQNKYEMMPEEIPSDIDMMYRGAGEKDLDALVIRIAQETRLLITQKIVQGYYEYKYSFLSCTGKPFSAAVGLLSRNFQKRFSKRYARGRYVGK